MHFAHPTKLIISLLPFPCMRAMVAHKQQLLLLAIHTLPFAAAFEAVTKASCTRCQTRAAAASLHVDGALATAVQYTVALPSMYALCSAHECA